MTDELTMIWDWGREPIPTSNEPQVAYLVVRATPTQPPGTPIPLNFCMVLDRSGSMQGSKLEHMKQATRRVIDMLTPHDIVSLVIFDDTVNVVVPATPVSNKADLLARIDSISEAGGTAMSLGLQAGTTELHKHHGDDRLSRMLLLTDGQTWGDEDTCRSIATHLGQMGVAVTALGLGDEWNEQLLDDIATATDGNADYIADAAGIDAVFQRAVARAQGTAITEARLLLRLLPDVLPRAVHRATPFIANLGYQPIGDSEVAVKMGDIAYDDDASLVFDLLIPARPVGSFRVAQAELHYTPVGGTATFIKQDIMLEVTSHPTDARHNPQVMNLVERVTAFKLQTRALAEAEAGNVAGATQKLRAAATRLLDMGEVELANNANQQAAQLEQGAVPDAAAQKELRYATRRLTQRLDSGAGREPDQKG